MDAITLVIPQHSVGLPYRQASVPGSVFIYSPGPIIPYRMLSHRWIFSRIIKKA